MYIATMSFINKNTLSLHYNFNFMRKKIFILLITSLLCLGCFAQSATKNHLELGFQFYGLPISEMNFPMGGMLKIGYDIVSNKKNLIFSIQPYIGGGLFAEKVLKERGTDYDFKYKYNIGTWEIGISPKLYYPLIEDDLYIYLANEFSFINMYARTWDNDKAPVRHSDKFMNFYYTCKIGILVKSWKQNAAFWIGYTTIDLAKTINKNRPHEVSPYRNEKPGICFGASLCW